MPAMTIETEPATKAGPGWYTHPKDKRRRYWTGTEWVEMTQPLTPTMRKPDSIGLVMAAGVVGAFLGGLGLLVNSGDSGGEALAFLSACVMAVGYTVMLVATIAWGVRFGFRHVDWERQRRS